MNIIELLKADEGFSARPYLCPSGKWTIGFGQRIEGGGEVTAEQVAAWTPGGVITEQAAAGLLRLSIERISMRLAYLSDSVLSIGWWRLDEVRRAVLISMAYQMGIEGLFNFRDMLDAMMCLDYSAAAAAMLASKWAEQTPARVGRLAQMMRTGEWAEAEKVKGRA